MSGVAFFDVDRTLVHGYTGFFATLILIQRKVIKKRHLPLAVFYRLVSSFHKGDVSKLYQLAINDMAGSRLKDILAIGLECFERWIRPRIYREGIRRIEEHKKKGDKVYLVTSGPTMVIQNLAEFLKVDGYYSAGPVVDEKGIMTDRLRLPVYYREGKIPAAEEVVQKEGVAWKDCSYYADDLDDLFLLEKVGHPIVVNPGRKLRKLALERGWPVLQFVQTNFKTLESSMGK